MESEEVIRVLVVDDIAETRENIRKLLQFENDVEVVGVARTGREGIEVARQTKPDVILMDINMPDMDGITATEEIRSILPTTQIVMLSVQGDTNYMRRAMVAGARDFLTKPPPVDELTSTIRVAGKMAIEARKKESMQTKELSGDGVFIAGGKDSLGKIVVVYSPKGGTGCTTVAVNLAVALHKEDTPVVIVDGNLQFGDIAVFLNEQSNNSIVDLAPRANELDPEIVDDVLISHASSGLHILPAPPRPDQAENVSGEQFLDVIQYLRRIYAYVVVDSDSVLMDITLAAMDASDLIILVTTQDIPSIKNTRLFFNLTDILDIDSDRILFVMNLFDRRVSITPEKVGQSLKHEVVSVLPRDERFVIPSVNRGKPFMLAEKTQPITREILALAESVRQSFREPSESEVEKNVTSKTRRLQERI